MKTPKYRIVLRVLPLLAALLSVPHALAVDKPTGTFSSSGASGTGIYANPNLRGVLIRANWSTLEPSPGVFDFSSLTPQITNVESYGLPWSLAVSGGGVGSPAWLTNPTGSGGLGAPYVNYTFQGVPGYKLPLFWNSIVQTRLQQLASALAAQYNGNPSLKLVYVTQMTANGIEGHLQGVNMTDLINAGYTDALWISAGKQAAQNFAYAFTDKALAFEVHDVNGGATVPTTIINDLWNDVTLDQRVGAAMWWISGKTSYQTALVDALTAFPGDIYGQIIGKSSDGPWLPNTSYATGIFRMPNPQPPTNAFRYEVTTAGTTGSTQPVWPTTVGATVTDGSVTWTCRASRFQDGDFTTVFAQAMAIGMRYIEPWEWEFKYGANSANGAWDTTMADYNAWADITFGEDTTPPAPPTGLSAVAGNGLVSLDWTDNSESDLLGYSVLRSTTSGGPYTDISGSLLSTSDFVDATVTNGTTYHYVVTAVDDSANESGYSTQVSATPEAPPPVTLLDEGFETGFGDWDGNGTTDWDRTTAQKHTGSYSAHAGSSDNNLTTDNLNTSGYSTITVEFWYRDDDIDDGDNIYLQLSNGSSYANRLELGNTSPEDTWHFATITLNNSGGDAQYFTANFRLRFAGNSIDSGENLWIDDVKVTVQ